MPKNDAGVLPIVQWPLFLLASKVKNKKQLCLKVLPCLIHKLCFHSVPSINTSPLQFVGFLGQRDCRGLQRLTRRTLAKDI
jgi:hypothetical protein